MRAKLIDSSDYVLINGSNLHISNEDEFEVVGKYMDESSGICSEMIVLRKFGYLPIAIEQKELILFD